MVVVAAIAIFFRGILGLVAGLFKVIVVTVVVVAALTWLSNRRRP